MPGMEIQIEKVIQKLGILTANGMNAIQKYVCQPAQGNKSESAMNKTSRMETPGEKS